MLLVTPNVIWFVAKRDEYFTTGATKITTGAIVSIVFMAFLLKGAFKDIDKRISTLITMGIVLIIVWLFETIISDMFYIIALGMGGYISYLIFSSIGKRDLEYNRVFKDETFRQEARQDAVNLVGRL